MKKSYWPLPLFIFILIFILTDKPKPRIQKNELDTKVRKISPSKYRIIIFLYNEHQKKFANIIWFNRAARLALDKKNPWFNVLEEKISLHQIEGTIELSADAMEAEYDAYEIQKLNIIPEI